MPTILVADDDAIIRELVCLFLRNDGFETLEAVDGKEALTVYASKHVDLVVLDIMMPIMDGWTLCKELRRANPDLPLLYSVIIAHVVYSLPFAMALIRLRLSQMNKDLEAAAWNLGASQWRALREVIIPFTLPAIFSALFLTMAVSFDEYAIAWFVSGFNETLPVRILILLQREVSPKVNAIGSLVFIVSMTLVMLAQIVFLMREPGSGKGKRI